MALVGFMATAGTSAQAESLTVTNQIAPETIMHVSAGYVLNSFKPGRGENLSGLSRIHDIFYGQTSGRGRAAPKQLIRIKVRTVTPQPDAPAILEGTHFIRKVRVGERAVFIAWRDSTGKLRLRRR